MKCQHFETINIMSILNDSSKLKLTLPKGRIQERVLSLLGAVGLEFKTSNRSYKPICSNLGVEAKILKAQNIPALVHLGRHDCGFTGVDWVFEQQADVVELLDLGFDPVTIVAAIPEALHQSADNPLTNKNRQIVIASEYERCTRLLIDKHQLNAVYVRSFGATEAFPPEDADMIVDNTATGSTLAMNRLVVVDEVMRSTTRFIASKEAMANPVKRAQLEELVMLMQARLRAKSRVLLEMNVSEAVFVAVIGLLADLSMNAPTVAPLHGQNGYAVKVAVPASDVPRLIPQLVAVGATDILEYKLEKIVP
jgi:ATP phosphoribosyltransferase